MRNENNRLVACLVENMLGSALDDVTCGDASYYRNAVEAFDLLSIDQRDRARKIYRYIISKNTHYASGALLNPANHDEWISDRIDEGPALDDWYEDDWDEDDWYEDDWPWSP
jgi:NADH:ubiquinone oxidoreductase subunit